MKGFVTTLDSMEDVPKHILEHVSFYFSNEKSFIFDILLDFLAKFTTDHVYYYLFIYLIPQDHIQVSQHFFTRRV